MKRLMGTLLVVAIVAVAAGAASAREPFSPLDRQRPGRTYHLYRNPAPAVTYVVPVPAGDMVRSFSYEPGAAPPAVSPDACCCRTACGCAVGATPVPGEPGTIRSFSYEPGAAPVMEPSAGPVRRHGGLGPGSRLWQKQHSQFR